MNLNAGHPDSSEEAFFEAFFNEATQMLAEKFLLLLETLRSQRQSDDAPRVVSSSPHVPVKLADGKKE